MIKVLLLLQLTVFSQNCFRLQAACFFLFFFNRALYFTLALSILPKTFQGSQRPQQSHSGVNTLQNNWMKANTELSLFSEKIIRKFAKTGKLEGKRIRKIADLC